MSESLISIGALTDIGCTLILLITTVIVMHQVFVSLTRYMEPSCGLWYVNIPATSPYAHIAVMPAAHRPVTPTVNISTAPDSPRNTATIQTTALPSCMPPQYFQPYTRGQRKPTRDILTPGTV